MRGPGTRRAAPRADARPGAGARRGPAREFAPPGRSGVGRERWQKVVIKSTCTCADVRARARIHTHTHTHTRWRGQAVLFHCCCDIFLSLRVIYYACMVQVRPAGTLKRLCDQRAAGLTNARA